MVKKGLFKVVIIVVKKEQFNVVISVVIEGQVWCLVRLLERGSLPWLLGS